MLDTRGKITLGVARLKSGNAQKICLNIIFSMLMVKNVGVRNKIFSNIQPTKKRLRKRKIRINKTLIIVFSYNNSI